jgi:hypothetical protein
MNSPLPASVPAQRHNWTRRLVNLLVALVVIAVAAAAFVFSYDGVHAIALLGGVSEQLARYYPGLFDAVLVIACVATVMLRDGRWWARLWAWVVIIVILAAIGTADVLHAMNYSLRHRPTEGIVAAAPVVAVLLAFSLLLALLRQSRTQAAEPLVPAPLDVPALPAAVSAPPIALPAAPVVPATVPAEQQDAGTGLAGTGLASIGLAATVPLPATAPEAVPAPEDSPAPGAAPTREVPVITDAQEAPGAAARQSASSAHSATEANEVIAPEAPASEATPVQDEPAPPTVQVPALSPEPTGAAPARGPQAIRYAGNGVQGQAIRYAGNGVQGMAGHDASQSADYWGGEEAGQLAGLVYPAREEHPDVDHAAADDADDVNDTKADGHAPSKNPPELDDDAPPFATAPFAPVPRLNRVRSMPTPPADEDE